MGFVKDFDKIDFSGSNLPFETQQAIHDRVRSLLPDDARIMLLSHTGSRAFGWGADCYDIDCRLVVDLENHWDTFHDGKHYDINAETFKHCLYGIKAAYWTTFEDMHYAFYLDDSWNHEEFKSLCNARNVKHHIYTIRTQIAQTKMTKNTRTALHTYRLLLAPIHIIRTGKMVPNIRELTPIYDIKYADTLADAYSSRKGASVDWDKVIAEIDGLYETMGLLLESEDAVFDYKTFERWKDRIINSR